MTHKPYLAPPLLSLDDLDPESATTDRLIALVRSHREGEEYPTSEQTTWQPAGGAARLVRSPAVG